MSSSTCSVLVTGLEAGLTENDVRDIFGRAARDLNSPVLAVTLLDRGHVVARFATFEQARRIAEALDRELGEDVRMTVTENR